MPRKSKYIWVPKTVKQNMFIPDEIWLIIFSKLSIIDLLQVTFSSKSFYQLIKKFNWKDYLACQHISFPTYNLDNFLCRYGKYIAKATITMVKWFEVYNYVIERYHKYIQTTRCFKFNFYLNISQHIMVSFTQASVEIFHVRRGYEGHSQCKHYFIYDPPDVIFKKLISTYDFIDIF